MASTMSSNYIVAASTTLDAYFADGDSDAVRVVAVAIQKAFPRMGWIRCRELAANIQTQSGG